MDVLGRVPLGIMGRKANFVLSKAGQETNCISIFKQINSTHLQVEQTGDQEQKTCVSISFAV